MPAVLEKGEGQTEKSSWPHMCKHSVVLWRQYFCMNSKMARLANNCWSSSFKNGLVRVEALLTQHIVINGMLRGSCVHTRNVCMTVSSTALCVE